MIITLLLTAVAFIIIFVEADGYVSDVRISIKIIELRTSNEGPTWQVEKFVIDERQCLSKVLQIFCHESVGAVN